MIIGIVTQKFFCKNLGVAAISYCSIQEILNVCKEINIEPELVIFSEDYETITKYIKETFNIEKLKCVPMIRVRNTYSYIKYFMEIAKCDLVFDTGLGDGFSDIYSSGKFLLQYLLKKIPELLGKKVILLPQTYGPYYNKNYEKMAATIIKRSYVSFARDNISYQYASKISKSKKVKLVTDLAMRLPYIKEKYSDDFEANGLKIGINISGLLYMGGYTQNNQFALQFDYAKFIEELIKRIHDTYACKIYLIPHVFLENDESDYRVSLLLKQKYSFLEIAPVFDSPIDAKSYIYNMDVFIGSRMHSTIAAFSTNVPVIPIGYSRKFNGLFETFGYRHFLDATKCNSENGIKFIINEINNLEILKKDINKSINIIDKYNDSFDLLIKEVLSYKRGLS